MKNSRISVIIIALLLTSFLVACGSDNKKSDDVNISMSPKTAGPIETGKTQSFSINVTGTTDTGYTVSAPAGAGCPSGAQSGGIFNCVPTAAGSHTITVTSSKDTTKSDSATLTVWAAFADTTVAGAECWPTIGTGANRIRIAVASNFREPADDLIKNWFLPSTYGANTAVQICTGSTGNFNNDFNANGFGDYKMFFAANTTAGNYEGDTGTTSFVYSEGVPVLAAKKTDIPSVTGLITGKGVSVPEGNVYTVTEPLAALSANYEVNTASAQMVSVADSSAPYGVAARDILNNMMGTSLHGTVPSWVFSGGNQTNGLWNNIDQTFWAVRDNSVTAGGTTYDTTDVKSGMIAKSSICSEIAPNVTNPSWVYVEFTNPGITLTQKAILLDPANATASKLNDYIQNAMTTGKWAEFLDKNCYLGAD